MGKIASKIWSKGLLCGYGVPEMHEELRPLASWSREELLKAYQRFLDTGEPDMDCHSFLEAFQCFRDTAQSKAAFKMLHPKKSKVDGNTVFAAAVLTSNQSYISRMSLIFSIFDLDNDGQLSKPEFCIAIRSVLEGLHRWFVGVAMPTDVELEVAMDDLFKRMDSNRSGFLSIGEFLVHSYRNRDLQEMVNHLPWEDMRVFESLVKFQRVPIYTPGDGAVQHVHSSSTATGSRPGSSASGQVPRTLDHHGPLRSPRNQRFSLKPPDTEKPAERCRVRRRTTSACSHLHPDMTGDKGTWCGSVAYVKLTGRKRGPSFRMNPVWTPPSEISKAHAWLLWKFFRHLSGGKAIADAERVQCCLKDSKAVQKELLQIAGEAKNYEPWALTEASADAEAPDGPQKFAMEVDKLSQEFQIVFTDQHLVQRLESLDSGPITVRCFLCISLPSLTPSHIEGCLAWCRVFRALEVLNQLGELEAAALKDEDLALLFEFLDVDASGDLSLSELVDVGQLPAEKAMEIFDKCKRQEEGAALNINDLRNYVMSLNLALGSDVKGLLESFAHTGHEKKPES